MREISPAENLSADELLSLAPDWVQERAAQVRAAKMQGQRPRPSTTLVDRSDLLLVQIRHRLLDKVAELVDENLFGRSEMCMQFAELLRLALVHLKLNARSALGTAIYYSGGREIFRWSHAWVRVGAEVVDGNVDSLTENPAVPSAVRVAPYWGPITATPSDRKLREEHGKRPPPDSDVLEVWWPELRIWLQENVVDGVEQRDHLTGNSRLRCLLPVR
jgi:hypothetical protein